MVGGGIYYNGVIDMNYGKIFEKEFKESAQKQGIWIMRINDTYVPAKAISEDSFIPQQPCDYVAHFDGTLWLLELKSTEKKYMTIERDGNRGMSKKHQYEQMFQKIGEHERAMLVLQFEREYTYGLMIEDFYRFLQENEKKSINKLDVVQYGGIIIEQKLLRKNYCYNVKKLLTSN